MNITREQWLNNAVDKMREGMFKQIGEKVPNVKVSIGFPSAGAKGKAIGECWKAIAAKDKICQIHITPKIDDAPEILRVLAHELIHAIKPDAGHGPVFKHVALALGFQKPMRTTPASDELKDRLNNLAKELGKLPHSALTPMEKIGGEKKQTTRLIKLECHGCGYVLRTTKQWLETIGAPLCACNESPMTHC